MPTLASANSYQTKPRHAVPQSADNRHHVLDSPTILNPLDLDGASRCLSTDYAAKLLAVAAHCHGFCRALPTASCRSQHHQRMPAPRPAVDGWPTAGDPAAQCSALHSTPLSRPELSIWATTCQPGPDAAYGALRPSSKNDRSINCSNICTDAAHRDAVSRQARPTER